MSAFERRTADDALQAVRRTLTGEPIRIQRRLQVGSSNDPLEREADAVPDLDVYFPKAGRSVEVDAACKVTVNKGIADAVFYAPAFFAVSSANVGNPKNDMSGTDFKFLFTRPVGDVRGIRRRSPAVAVSTTPRPARRDLPF